MESRCARNRKIELHSKTIWSAVFAPSPSMHFKNELLKVVVPSALTGFLYNPLSALTGLFI